MLFGCRLCFEIRYRYRWSVTAWSVAISPLLLVTYCWSLIADRLSYGRTAFNLFVISITNSESSIRFVLFELIATAPSANLLPIYSVDSSGGHYLYSFQVENFHNQRRRSSLS